MSTVPDSLPPLNDVDADFDPTTEMEVDLPPGSPDPNLNGGLSTPMSPTPPSGPQPRSSPRPKPPPGTVDESAKTVYLIRHGASRHNHHNVNLESPVLLDASLDIVGVHQAVALGIRYRNAIGDAIVNPPPKRSAAPYIPAEVELVCVSPLTRCLETAHHAFAIGAPKSPKETGAMATAEDLAKKKKKHVPSEKGKRAPVPMMHPNPPPPFVCHDALREATGVNYPDKRRSKSAIKAAFPTVDFSNVLDEDDLLWKPNKREVRECFEVAQLHQQVSYSSLHSLVSSFCKSTVAFKSFSRCSIMVSFRLLCFITVSPGMLDKLRVFLRT